jgi:hypothetical protein
VVEHYPGLIDGFVLDARDGAIASQLGVQFRTCDTLMLSRKDQQRVATCALDLMDRITGALGRDTRPAII